MAVMKEVQRVIKEMTCTMENEAYIEFMRELSEWADSQASLAEFVPDYDETENN